MGVPISGEIPSQRTGSVGEQQPPPPRTWRVLTLDCASSRLTLTVLDGETVRFRHTLPNGHGRPSWPEVQDLLVRYDPVDAAAIRVRHGGHRIGPVVLDDVELDELSRLAARAPGDQEREVELARVLRELVPTLPLIGCFDTSFHRGLPDHAALYALPRPWSASSDLRRAGFGGLACDYAQQRAAAMLRTPLDLLNLVVTEVGDEVAVTATAGGRSVDTSTGFTTLDGAVSATRSGSLDPGLLLHLAQTSGQDLPGLRAALAERAGLTGLTGGTGDLREVLAARAAGDQEAALALQVYLHRLRREVAAAATSLESLDALVLTGEIAEQSAWLRSELTAGLAALGVRVDHVRNRAASSDALLSEPGAPVAVVLVQERMDVMLARGAATVLAGVSGERTARASPGPGVRSTQ